MKSTKAAAVAVMLVAIAAGLFLYWRHEERYPSTKDAYIGANVINVAAQVTGQVAEVPITDNQQIKAGDLLFTIDDTQFKATVDQSKANLDSAIQQAQSYSTQITAAQALVESTQSVYDTAKKNLDRSRTLFSDGDLAQASLDQITSEFAQASARLTTAQSSLLALQRGGGCQTGRYPVGTCTAGN